MKSQKKIYTCLIVISILAFSISQISAVHSEELTVQNKALSAINDIIGFDLTKYNVELTNYRSEQPEAYGGLVQEDITYSLKSEDNKNIDVNIRFVNSTLAIVNIYPYNSSIATAQFGKQFSTNILIETKEVLQRLQAVDGAQYLQQMCDMLDKISDIQSANKTVGNLKLQVTTNTNFISQDTTATFTTVSFMYASNESVDSPKSINIYFRNGELTGFSNGWKFFSIGSEKPTLSREKAISLAMEQAEIAANSSLSLRNETIRIDLHMSPREPFVLYPFWFVEIPLYYPNSTINGWQVGIWADTGEIEYSHPTGIMGTVPDTVNLSTDTTPTNIATQAPQNSPNTAIIIAIIAVLIISVILSAVIIKPRK
jgi:hypothetical protein